MDKTAFVNAIRMVVEDAAVSGTISALVRPPDRRPAEDRKQISAWFNALSMQDREKVERVIQDAVRAAVFDFLCVLDGVLAIEDSGEKGELELVYRKGRTVAHLNDLEGGLLHDLFNAR